MKTYKKFLVEKYSEWCKAAENTKNKDKENWNRLCNDIQLTVISLIKTEIEKEKSQMLFDMDPEKPGGIILKSRKRQ